VRLHVTGASGSGATTLGRAVEVPVLRLDSATSVAGLRDAVERVALMEQVFLPRLSGSMLERRRGSVDEAFLAWARGYDDPAFDGRNRARHEAWLATLEVPVLRLDSATSVARVRDAVLARLRSPA
jgi:hypothetical protein